MINFDDDIALTAYRFRQWDGVDSVEATAQQSMALLARPLTVDLQATPVLCWRWRVEAALVDADMQRKAGDDYAARVYVAFSIPAERQSFGLRSKLRLARMIFGDQVPDAALSYVWDNRHPIGTTAPNAYTERTRMIVLRSGNDDAKRWVSERRNVLTDVLAAFPESDPSAASLAVGSDTDNTGESAQAGFADLHFVAADEPCVLPAEAD